MWLPVKLTDGRISVKKENKYSHLIYNIFSPGKMAGKSFSWRLVEHELKVNHLEKLAFKKFYYLNDIK